MNRLWIALYVLRYGYTPDEPHIRWLWAALLEAWDRELVRGQPGLSADARARIWREHVAPVLGPEARP